MNASASRLSLGGKTRVGWGGRGGADLFAVEGGVLSLRGLRTYRFTPDQVVAIEPLGPRWLSGGVRIVHNQADYPRLMSFYCSGGSAKVFELLALAGFVPRGSGPAAGRSRLRAAVFPLLVLLVINVIVSGLLRLLH
ncbi:hypothetical protein LRH25_12960 [Ideonella azotifigens]|uniref:Uncharacterized protein n=1 Tax=Ideonella azotifigens TaxID=513160 RepID=A0ABN1JXC3_9BURK|nr:hypothetical protein [Ideonella azotifigens]MCD2341252.1 hypothetical protein [Ideonella azotifigens]